MGMKQKMHHERVHRNDTVWSRVFDVFNVIVLIFVAFITIAPFLYVIACGKVWIYSGAGWPLLF